MKKVLIIGPFPDPISGVSLANKTVLDNLKLENNFEVDYINTSFNKFDEGIGVVSFSKIIFYLKFNFSIFKIFKFDTIYITPGQTFFGVVKYTFFILFTKFLNKELIVHIHGNYVCTEYIMLKGFKKKLFKYLLGKSDKGIVLSESLKHNMTPFLNQENVYILYNFVESYLFIENNLIQDKLLDPKPRIVFLSNLMEEKGIFELFEALTILENNGFEYEAKIAGNIDIKNKDRIENYFKNLKNTEYIGVVHGEKKKSLLLWGNIFILATYYKMEGQPISILEAMATGNLILTTEHAGIPDIFSDCVNGYFVEKKKSESIVDKIIESTKNVKKSDKIRLNNFKTAKEKYGVGNFMNKIIEIIKA